MRRAILIPLLALMLGFGSVAGSEAAFYVGGGKGVKVTFRVKGHKLIQATVVARLYCFGPHGRRHFNRIRDEYAFADSPLRLNGQNRFRWDTRGERQEEGFAVEDFLAGHVGRDLITGKYEYIRSYSLRHRHEDCRTGSDPLKPGETEVAFRARRQVSGS
jgi:hypothetical protein